MLFWRSFSLPTSYSSELAVPSILCNRSVTGCLIEESYYWLKTGKIICYSPSLLFFNLTFTICQHLLAVSEQCCGIVPNSIVNGIHCNVVHSCQQKSIGLKFSKSQTGSDLRYSCHHNSSGFTFPIFAHSCCFSVLHSLQSVTPCMY